MTGALASKQTRAGSGWHRAKCKVRARCLAGPIMEIVDEVRQVIAKTLKVPVDRLALDTRLEDIGAESLDVIEIVFELEEKFGISIPYQGFEGTRSPPQGPAAEQGKVELNTIGQVANAVKTLVEAKAAS
jgi:acyl carrier protein